MKLVLENTSSRYGAQMGRKNVIPVPALVLPKLKLLMIRLQWVDGDYDEGGVYWGQTKGTHIFSAFSLVHGVRIFVRATGRNVAKDEVRKLAPNAVFYR